MIKAIFLDIDGTMLSNITHRVPESTIAAVRKLQERGILCVVATGRFIGAIKQLPVAEIPFDGYITLNGQVVLDRDQQVLWGMPITGRAREYLLRAYRENHFPAMILEKDDLSLNFINDHVRHTHTIVGTEIPPVRPYSGRDIYQVSAYVPEAQQHILAEIRDDCEITYWFSGGVDIIAKGGGKILGLQHYLSAMGIKPEETAAIGDGANDMDMLRYVGLGIAMGNASDAVKACADYVTGDVDEDGFAQAMEHFHYFA